MKMEVVRLDRVSKDFGNKKVLREISLAVGRGDIFGYLGPNGAGKTTTIRIMLGLLEPSCGEVRILGGDPRDPEIRRRVGFVLEIDGLYENLSAFENLLFWARIYKLGGIESRAKELLEFVGLEDHAAEAVRRFSRGMRQRLALARALLADPDVLILDEPTSGLDPSGQMEIRRLIRDFARSGGTVFLSSHNLDEVQRLCNRIAFIHRGEIRLCGETEELVGGKNEIEIKLRGEIPHLHPILARFPYVRRWRLEGDSLFILLDGGEDISDVLRALLEAGGRIDEVKRRRLSLEEVYSQAVGGR